MTPTNNTDLLLVCGIPGAGKSTYCEWLEEQKGFLHLDFDKLFRGQRTSEKLALVEPFQRSLDEFASTVRDRGQSVVIDWGFPPANNLETVRTLKQLGFAVWWFDGNRTAARISFKNRGTVSMKALQIQMESIEREWPRIKELIQGNVIEAILPGPNHRPAEWIYDRMFSASITKIAG